MQKPFELMDLFVFSLEKIIKINYKNKRDIDDKRFNRPIGQKEKL